ncbi:acyl-CoA N-acyltransferase [Cercophora newfieldiana]|uniref:Acyl-CoA N-acyltransferase n=1 Tax=Cercophora newfieldiana TaxID=92897 RepID=A0AA39XT99_9PEZI|nr:acyl-CoA N-acyltransferase [Cercophora newfieldiana]
MDTTFTISPVTVADGPALAAVCIPAFWTDPHWRLEWRHRTLDYHISQVALRYPRNLLRNRLTARHQKAVDNTTGEILGYARWSLPASHATTPVENGTDAEPAWPEALVPPVSADEEAEIVRVADTAVWDPDLTSDPLLDAPMTIKGEILAQGTFMTLDYLAVHPKHQRRGVATALVRSGMREAGALGLDIFVHAMRPGVPVYMRLGFRLERELAQDDSMYGGPGLFSDYFLILEQPIVPEAGKE